MKTEDVKNIKKEDLTNFDVIVALNGMLLRKVPEEQITSVTCMLAVKQHGNAIQFVPKKHMTKELCMMAAQAGYLGNIPREYRSRDICLTAVRVQGKELASVPAALKDREMCETALRSNAVAWESIPKEFADSAMAEIAKTYDPVVAIQFLPEEFIDEKTCYAALENHGWALEYVPKCLRTHELCLYAMQQPDEDEPMPDEILDEVPSSVLDLEIIHAAIRINPYVIESASIEEFMSQELCDMAFGINPHVIIAIPDEYKNYEMCLKAVKDSGELIEAVPQDYLTHSLCLEAIKSYVNAYPALPEKFQEDEEICAIVMAQTSEYDDLIPEEILDKFNGSGQSAFRGHQG